MTEHRPIRTIVDVDVELNADPFLDPLTLLARMPDEALLAVADALRERRRELNGIVERYPAVLAEIDAERSAVTAAHHIVLAGVRERRTERRAAERRGHDRVKTAEGTSLYGRSLGPLTPPEQGSLPS